jgi:DNA-binding CsgD family transcriptional regulator
MNMTDNAIIARVQQLQIGLNEVSVKQSMLNSELTKLIGDILRRSAVADAPPFIQAIPRALENQGSDSVGAIGPRERDHIEAGSEQTPTVATQGRNEPASVEAVAGAKAGEGNEGSEPPPAPRDLKREIILDLWNEGKLTREEIADRAGSTVESIKVVVSTARRAGDVRALHKRCPRHVPTVREVQAEKRNAVLDAFAAGMTMPDIAVNHGISLNSVKSVVRRARGDSDERAAIRRVAAPKAIQEFAGKGRGGDGDGVQSAALAGRNASMPSPANTTHDAANEKQREIARDFLAKRPAPIEPKPKPRIMSTKEVMARLAGEVAARAVKPAPEPYSTPMEPTEAKPIPAAELPAPVPMIDVADDKVMVVADGVVHGPDGIEERLGPKEIKILARMADGGMYPADVLAEIGGAKNDTFTYLMNGMRAKLAAIGVELFAPMKGYWRARRSGE